MKKRPSVGGAAVDEFSKLTNGRFSFMPDGEIGATDSRHKVFFGRLGIEPVAVKPTRDVRAATHEKRMLEAVHNVGITAVKPLAIYEARDRGAFLVTRRIPLVSVASLPMTGNNPRKVRDTERVITTVAETLADMAARGISHGDSQAKNFGLTGDRAQPSIVVYDLEKGGTDQIGHVKSNPYGHDLDSVAQSLAYKGYGGPNLEAATNDLERVVLKPYYDRVTAQGFDRSIADYIVSGAYGSFIDIHDSIVFQQSFGGHDAHRANVPVSATPR